MKRIGTDVITGQPLLWSGTGRPPSFAVPAAGKLDRYLVYADRALAELLDAEAGPLGHFADADRLRDVARRYMRVSNAIFNRLRSYEAAQRRDAEAQAAQQAAQPFSQKGGGQ